MIRMAHLLSVGVEIVSNGNIGNTSERRWNAYGLFRAHKYHLELKRTGEVLGENTIETMRIYSHNYQCSCEL